MGWRAGALAFGLALAFVCPCASALNPGIRIADLNHARWTEKDGMPSEIECMAQTVDGWLWLGTMDGLYRFDGVSFERVPVKFGRITHLSALANGDLLVASLHGGLIALHHDGRSTELANDEDTFRMGSFRGMMADREGAIWATALKGLFRYRKGKWENIGGNADWAPQGEVLVDQQDQVWYANDRGLYRFDRSSGKLKDVPQRGKGGTLIQSPDGGVWSNVDGVLHLVSAVAPGAAALRAPRFNHLQSRAAGQFDRDGNFWAPHCSLGLCRIARTPELGGRTIDIEQQASDGLYQQGASNASHAKQVMEDREGNIWAITASALERFRENKLIPLRTAKPSVITAMAKDGEGRIWARDNESDMLWQVAPDGSTIADARRDISAMVRGRDGALLLAGKRFIERVDKGQPRRIALPSPGGVASDLDVLGILDDGKVLWMASMQTGLMGYVDGEWKPRSAFNLPRRINMTAAGGVAQLWLSHSDGFLSLYDDGKLTRYDIALVGQESGIFPGTEVVVGGERGIAVLRGQKFERLLAHDAEVLRNVSGMAVTPDGDRWLNGARGVVHIKRDAWEASVRQPSVPLAYEVIDALEGYPGRAVIADRLPSVFNAGNGQLWFRASGGVVRLDTAALKPNTVKPIVRLLRVNTDKGSFDAKPLLHLPPDSRNFNIQYSAPGLSKPEAMRFQYRLQDVDQHWQDAGARRSAYYNNIDPGRYRFQVRAVNEDGVAGDTAAALELNVAPTLTQTWWFKVACSAIGLLLLYGVYRYRLSAATGVALRQVLVRQDERDRIARTLHDTFLQTVQVLILQVHSVSLKLPAGSELRDKLEKILLSADDSINEGRRQVQQLRAGPEIELSLRRTGEMLSSMHAGVNFAMSVSGKCHALDASVQEDLCAIGQEALHNAFQHAQASLVTVSLEYGKEEFVLRVADDGRGIDEVELAGRIKAQRWGIVGLRERAVRIGASLSIKGSQGKGTTVQLSVSAGLAYADKAEQHVARID